VKSYKEYGRSKVDHATAGAQFSVEKFGSQLGWLLAYIIAGHHSGLPNGKDNNQSSLFDRLEKQIPDFDKKFASGLNLSVAPEEIAVPKIPDGFDFSFFVRMVFSCLVDADFLDTERFIDFRQSQERLINVSLEELQDRLAKTLQGFDTEGSEINRNRAEILSECINAADKPPGFFSLTVPTGGGKTLSSLAFALKHALKHGKDRIIYVIPYTSIIEQTADVFRKALGDDAVLEHHSNFDPDSETRFSKLASQNWDAPIIVTTNVQFFESLLGNKSSKTRKLHNIANSVIILDEAQMLPIDYMGPCLRSLRLLVECYRSSVVLCTATQPVLAKTEQFKIGLDNIREIVSDPHSLYEAFQRVCVKVIKEPVSNTGLVEKLMGTEQCLCIVSTRKHAREIFENLQEQSKADGAFHLSTNMCPNHRSVALNTIRDRLRKGQECRVVSTQLIEAGVDVDFPRVFRSMAGLDSIAQSAGRCNREGKFHEGEVFVFHSEYAPPPGFLRHCADEGEQVLRNHEDDPLSLNAGKDYFERLYWRKTDNMDKKGILKRLETSECFREGKPLFPFKDIAQDFKLIETDTRPIIVPYDYEAKELCAELRKVNQRPEQSRFIDRMLEQKLQRYSVQVHARVFTDFQRCSILSPYLDERFWVLENLDVYDQHLGLKPEDPTFYETETLIL